MNSGRTRYLDETTWHHMYDRGADGQNIFSLDGDQSLFENLIGETVEVCDVGIHAYVSMSNHFHFLIRDSNRELSEFIQFLADQADVALWSDLSALDDCHAVHFAERLVDQLDPLAIGSRAIQRTATHDEGLDASSFELALQSIPVVRRHRDGEVVVSAEHLGVLIKAETREVKEGQSVAVADVEEEVSRSRIVTVFEEFRQRKLQEPLVEVDCSLDVARDERLMMHTAR